MKVYEILSESLSHNDAESIIRDFLKFVKNFLKLDELPVINLIKDSDYSIKHRSFGGYSPSDKSINVMISNRHIQDLLRTIAHETVHFKQDLNGELNDDSGNDGSQEENEANSTAAIILRKWGKLHPALFGYEPIQ